MSDPSHSPHHDPLQSDAISGGEQTPIQPDPETAPPTASHSFPDPAEENSPGEEDEDDEEGEEADDETPAVSSMDLRPQVSLASPNARRGGNKRKKGKGKGKRKPTAKQLQMIEEKLRNLRSNLNPIRFDPQKLLHFAVYENLFKKLGLWEFVQIDFDRTIRVDFIAQLVANYNPKSRSSNVNGYRVVVSRADLARALKLPLKKEKGNAVGAEVDLEWEALSDESIAFIEVFVSDWVLLHEDTWMMPNVVMEWMKLIKEGHPEKVDWAGLLWFMVEKELKQGGQLKECYYASHLQHLIKCQHEKVFLMEEEPLNAEVESVAEVEVVKDEVNEGIVKENEVVEIPADEREGDLVVEGPSTELTLGQDGEKEEEEEEVKEVEMVDAEKCEESDGEEGGDEREEQEQWLPNGKNNLDEHFLQHCSTENAEGFDSFEDRNDEGIEEEEEDQEEEEEEEEEMDAEEDEEEAPNNYHVFPNGDSLEGDVHTGNFLQGMEGNQMGMAFTSQEQHPNSSSVDINVQNIASAPPFFNNAGKRVIDHDYHDAVNDSSKRMRVNEMWDAKPADFGMCMEQIQQAAQRARMLFEEKEQVVEQATMNQQLLLNELEKRDHVIEGLHKARFEEAQRKDMEIGRLERELYLLGSMVGGYRKALKDVQKAFAEYRDRAQLYEEPTYKDTGNGGLMLSAAEIERRRKVEEEEFRMKCLYIEQIWNPELEKCIRGFEALMDKVNLKEKRLIGLEADAKELIAMYSKKKIPKTEVKEEDEDDEMHEVAGTLPVPEADEPVAEEVSEAVPSTEPEEQVAEAAEDPEIPQGDEKVVEVAEPPSLE